jgi:hypothetical protein
MRRLGRRLGAKDTSKWRIAGVVQHDIDKALNSGLKDDRTTGS